jgi:hypothetical protein
MDIIPGEYVQDYDMVGKKSYELLIHKVYASYRFKDTSVSSFVGVARIEC